MARLLKNKDLGFTLIEVSAVTCLLGLVTLLCVPNFKDSLQNYRLAVTVQEVGQNIRLAQKLAITEGVSYKVLFDLENKITYRIASGYKATRFDLPLGVCFDWANFPKSTLAFYPSGAPSQGGTIAIKNKNKSLYVIVSVATGRVRIGKTPP